MTREEWELERKEKKKEKKEKKKKEKREKREKREKKEKRKRKNEDEEEREERRAIVKSTKPDEAGMAGLDAARRLSSPGRLLRRQPSVRGGRVLGSRFLRRAKHHDYILRMSTMINN